MAYGHDMPPDLDVDRASAYEQLEPAQLAGLVVEAVGLEPDTVDGAQVATAMATLIGHLDQLLVTNDRTGQRVVDGLAALSARLLRSVPGVSVGTESGGVI